MKRKLLSIVLCLAIVASFFTAIRVPALAKTPFSQGAPSLIVNIINPDGTVTLVHEYTGVVAGEYTVYDDGLKQNVTYYYYTYPELEAIAGADFYYYATIDAMPAAVGTKAHGVTINALVNNAKTYNSNIKWESGQRFALYPTDAPTTPYQSKNFYNYDFVQGQARYYYPNLVEAYTAYRANGEDTSYLEDWDADLVAVEPVLCLSSFQERYTTDAMLKSTEEHTYSFGTPGTADYREIHTPLTLDRKESFRFCIGLTPTEAINGVQPRSESERYSSTNKFCRWTYRIDFGPVDGPALWGDITQNVQGQPIMITFTDNTAWRSGISSITVDGVTVDPSHYTIGAGAITLDSTVFTANGSHIVTVAATGFMNDSMTQKIGVGPTLTADDAGNIPNQPIDITFTESASWRAAITGVTVNGTAVMDYSLTSGKLTLPGTHFPAPGNYNIAVAAANYIDDTLTQAILNLPPVLSVDSPRVVGQPFSLVFSDNAAWRAAIKDIRTRTKASYESESKLSGCTITSGVITFASGTLSTTSQSITISATNYLDAAIQLPGNITADYSNNTAGQIIELTYPSDSDWYPNITGVMVNGLSIAGHYTRTSAKIAIDSTVFTTPGDYTVMIRATGYADGMVIQTIRMPVTGVSLDQTTMTIPAGGTGHLIQSVVPPNASNQSVSWNSGNATVATVSSSGLVTAWTVGTATITVTTAEGGFTATCAVTVVPDTLTVAFDSQGGSAVSDQTVAYGGLMTPPATPARAGYAFGGWYREADCLNGWNFTTDTVTSNITLYAQWTNYAKGDVNADGKINGLDVVKTVNYILGKATLTTAQFNAADYNGDGKVNGLDIVKIVNKILGRI